MGRSLLYLRNREQAGGKEGGCGRGSGEQGTGAAIRIGFVGSVRRLDFILRTIGSFRRVSGRLVTCLAAGG